VFLLWRGVDISVAGMPLTFEAEATMTTLAICAIFKDEGPDLMEWVAYHRAIGVDHFFLYDNESTDDGTLKMLSGPFKDYITVVPISSRPAQQRAYKHFMDCYANDWDWAAFIDLDEFIHPIETDSIKDLLWRYEPFSGVLLHWLMFGPNGHDKRPGGLVIENYTRRLPEKDPLNRHVKSLLRTAHIIGEPGVHVFSTKGPICNSRVLPVLVTPIQDEVCHELICINHYYTKSREDWDAKLRRGRADVPELRADPENAVFDSYARRANISDDRITRFAERIKSMLGLTPDRNSVL
jgi:hypothetical protein